LSFNQKNHSSDKISHQQSEINHQKTMNPNLTRLFQIAQKPARLIIGLMSGTSLDGLDVALCKISGNGKQTKAEVLHFETVPYREDFKAEVRTIFARKTIDFEHLVLLNEHIGTFHAKLILDCLQKWQISPAEVDLIASHGQTVYHAPKNQHGKPRFPNATLQIGDGDHIAVHTGIITLSDFRQKHLAAGGEGAPLAVYGDYLLFSQSGESRFMLNLGGIANFTFLPAGQEAGRVFSTDVGPGNTLTDSTVRKFFPEKSFDENGSLAASGKINEDLLRILLADDFFHLPFPKTTGPEVFNQSYLQKAQSESQTESISLPDLLATLTRFSAEGIALAVRKCFAEIGGFVVYLSGGGMHNPVLVKYLQELLPELVFKTTADLHIPPDAKEAVLFALLANETIAGEPIDFGRRQGIPGVTMGKLSFPH
jgi:anhydro-N-acetylmuramic acid kinase